MTVSAAEIQRNFETESKGLRQFIALLEREQQMLLSPEVSPLLELATEKTRLADNLAANARQRQKILPSAPGAAETWLKKNAPDACDAWHDLLALATRARQMNQTNGELIQVRLRYNQQALHALISASQQAAGVYGPNGQPSLGGSGRTLGSG
ncbi:MAG: hypothetical protein Fur0026_00240 [Sideroxydans sp.]